MRRSLHAALEHARDSIFAIRDAGIHVTSDIETRLGRLEHAITQALASSPDGQAIAHAEEQVVLEAAHDLRAVLPAAPDELAVRLRPVVTECLSHAPAEGGQVIPGNTADLEEWLDSGNRSMR